jgi:hypothetical protein
MRPRLAAIGSDGNSGVLHFRIEDRSGKAERTSAMRRIMQPLGEPTGDALSGFTPIPSLDIQFGG